MKHMQKREKKDIDRSVSDRWTKTLTEDGFVPVVNFFLEHYHELKPYDLTHGEAMFVIHLMSYKWTKDAPYPAFKSLAKLMGVTDKQARRYAQSLEEKSLLRREFRTGLPNKFDLNPLFKALEKHRAQKSKK